MYNLSKLAAGSVVVATAAIGSAGVALADGYEPKGRVVYERPSDWSGVYFGVSSGYQWSNVEVRNTGAGGFGIKSDHDETLLGGHIGAQHQFGSIVLGVEGGWQASLLDHDGSHSACATTDPRAAALPLTPALTGAPGTSSCMARFNDVLTVGGRVGWAAGHWMPYLTGGYANGGFDFEARAPIPGGANTTATLFEEAHKRLDGYYLGGGFEWKISAGWTAGLEYRHYGFDTGRTTAFSPGIAGSGTAPGLPAGVQTGTPMENVRFDATTDTVTARVSWRWGRPEAAPLK